MASFQELAGFKDRLSWRLFKWLAIPWFIFVLLRLPMLSIEGVFCNPDAPAMFHAQPSQCHWHLHATVTRYRVGIVMHLSGVLPAGLVAVVQFVPAARRLLGGRVHRVLGYASVGGVLWGSAGVLLIMDQSFGGDVSTQSMVLFLATISAYTLTRGVREARARRFAAHRAWMLRAWAYLAAILTMRPFLLVSAVFMSFIAKPQFNIMLCDEIMHVVRVEDAGGPHDLLSAYARWPECDPGSSRFNPAGMAIVEATIANGNHIEEVATTRASFGSVTWVALAIHILAVEIYLNRKQAAKPTDSKVTSARTPALEKANPTDLAQPTEETKLLVPQ